MEEEIEWSEVRQRGEITIPKKIREEFHLDAGQHVEFIPIGKNAVLLTPKRLDREEARKQIRRILKQTATPPERVLSGLSESREETFQKHYGKKPHGRRP